MPGYPIRHVCPAEHLACPARHLAYLCIMSYLCLNEERP
jgi:hypothetical protein